MANKNERLPENSPGAYYVDSTCIDCDLCRSAVPVVFSRIAETGSSFVQRQPVTQDEITRVEEVLQACPIDSIGNDG